ncbi:alpha/beta hydrolase [Kribbella sp. NPDC058245]|uniref:alpha/beta hydrolase n=1 Tax=Kribbella sp. NPDC058245 TaxID=3346399 RepID=UPI0036EB2D4F
MSYTLDPELVPAMAALAVQAAQTTPPARGDWRAVRAAASAGLAYLASITPPSSGVSATSFSTPTSDGRGEIELRWYTTAMTAPGRPAVVYTHGGGMLGGSIDLYHEVVSWYVAESGVPFLSVELRLAPEATSPTSLAEDVFSGLTWLADHATDLGVDPSRIAVMGDSGGGAPTAGAAILARDRGVPVAKQILIYPMLDDRNTTPDSLPAELLTWNHDNNYTGWVTLLGDALGTDDVSPVASPARLTDFARLAPAYIEVGDLDIFRNESIAYALGLATAGVPTELHVHPGAPHGFERFVPDAGVARRAMADRVRAVATV